VTRRALPERIGTPLDQGLQAGEPRCSHGLPHTDSPEFQALMAEGRADMAAQLARVREMERGGELTVIARDEAALQ